MERKGAPLDQEGWMRPFLAADGVVEEDKEMGDERERGRDCLESRVSLYCRCL